MIEWNGISSFETIHIVYCDCSACLIHYGLWSLLWPKMYQVQLGNYISQTKLEI